MPSNHLILCCPLLLLPSVSQNQGLFQRVSSSHQVAKVLEFPLQHQSFQWIFRLISFRMDWLDLLAVQGTLKSLLQHHSSKASMLLRDGVSQSVSSVTQSCLTLCDPMDCGTPGLPVHHQLPELTQTHVHWVSDAIQPPHSLSSPSPPTFNLSQLQGLFKWVSSSHQVTKVLDLQLQHQSFQWIFRTYFL